MGLKYVRRIMHYKRIRKSKNGLVLKRTNERESADLYKFMKPPHKIVRVSSDSYQLAIDFLKRKQ
jgi:hypothetical protein